MNYLQGANLGETRLSQWILGSCIEFLGQNGVLLKCAEVALFARLSLYLYQTVEVHQRDTKAAIRIHIVGRDKVVRSLITRYIWNLCRGLRAVIAIRICKLTRCVIHN